MTAVDLSPLDAAEPTLADLEVIVAAHIDSFLIAGRALAIIHDRKLYKETHRDWDSYCKAQWSMSGRSAYRQIGQGRAAEPDATTAPSQRSLAKPRKNATRASDFLPVIDAEGEEVGPALALQPPKPKALPAVNPLRHPHPGQPDHEHIHDGEHVHAVPVADLIAGFGEARTAEELAAIAPVHPDDEALLVEGGVRSTAELDALAATDPERLAGYLNRAAELRPPGFLIRHPAVESEAPTKRTADPSGATIAAEPEVRAGLGAPGGEAQDGVVVPDLGLHGDEPLGSEIWTAQEPPSGPHPDPQVVPAAFFDDLAKARAIETPWVYPDDSTADIAPFVGDNTEGLRLALDIAERQIEIYSHAATVTSAEIEHLTADNARLITALAKATAPADPGEPPTAKAQAKHLIDHLTDFPAEDAAGALTLTGFRVVMDWAEGVQRAWDAKRAGKAPKPSVGAPTPAKRVPVAPRVAAPLGRREVTPIPKAKAAQK